MGNERSKRRKLVRGLVRSPLLFLELLNFVFDDEFIELIPIKKNKRSEATDNLAYYTLGRRG